MDPTNPFYVQGQEDAARALIAMEFPKADGVGAKVVIHRDDDALIGNIIPYTMGVHSVGRGITIEIR